jgi:hypothetical protein
VIPCAAARSCWRSWLLGEVKVLRKIFRKNSDAIAKYWRKLHNEEIRNLYSQSDIVRVMK